MLSLEFDAPPPLESHQQHFPVFSIRDYVFTARHKHIESNWPFSKHQLQLCSNLKIKDVLPPFEPPDSIRKQFHRKSQPHSPSKKATVTFSGQAPHDQQKITSPPYFKKSKLPIQNRDAQSKRESAPSPSNSDLLCSLQQDSESPLHLQNSLASNKNKTAAEPTVRKCRLIFKLATVYDPIHAQDIASNTTTLSDSMTSKVCPVCKTFLSTSNTTLNAHIDQCLAVESTSKWLTNDTKLTKPIMNLTKKRSMVDIYATARPCTLEDLDRRNGSNWASDSNALNAVAKVTADGKKRRLPGEDLQDISDESSVYFDSNGTKLRIISKLPNGPASTAAGDEPRKLIKNGKESKIISFNAKKDYFQPKNAKSRKPKLRNKRLCALKSNEVGRSGAQEMKRGIDKDCEKEECISQPLKASDGINFCDFGTPRQWVCSKRTGRLKRVSGNTNHNSQGFSPSISVERNAMNFGDSSLQGRDIISDLCENEVSSSKTMYADSSFHDSQVTDCGVDSYTKHNTLTKERSNSGHVACLEKLHISSVSFASFSRSKTIEVNATPACNSDNSAKYSEAILSNDLVFKPSLSKLNGKRSALNNPRMHRSIAEMNEQVGAQPLHVEKQYACVLNSAKSPSWRYCDGSNDKGKENTEKFEVRVLKARSQREASNISDWYPMSSKDASKLGAESNNESPLGSPLKLFYAENIIGHETGVEDVHVHVDKGYKTFSKEAVGLQISKSNMTFASKFCKLSNSSHARANSLRSTGEHKRRVCGTEKIAPLVRKLRETQVPCDVCRIGEDTGMTLEANSHIGFSSSEGPCRTRQTNSTAAAAAAQPGSLLPSLWDINSDGPRENSSLTSSPLLFMQDRYRVPDRESSESCVSAMSTISYPTISRSGLKFLDPESRAKPCAVEDTLILGFSGSAGDATTCPFRRVEMVTLGGKSCRETTISPTEESASADDHPCRCLLKRSSVFDAAPPYQDRQYTWDCLGMPAKEKQMLYNMNMGTNKVLVKPDSFPVSRNSEMVPNICESHRGSFFKHSSPDDISTRGTLFLQSTSNPVLRLMGKDLMVVNNDDDVLRHKRYINHLQFSPECFVGPEGSVASSQDSCNLQPHFLDDDFSKSFRNRRSRPRQQIVSNHKNMETGGVDPSLMWNGSNSKLNVHIQHIERLDSCVGRVSNSNPEVIVIDDSPERYRDGLMGSQSSNPRLGVEPGAKHSFSPAAKGSASSSVYHSPSFLSQEVP